jgi:hypothetical protein
MTLGSAEVIDPFVRAHPIAAPNAPVTGQPCANVRGVTTIVANERKP